MSARLLVVLACAATLCCGRLNAAERKGQFTVHDVSLWVVTNNGLPANARAGMSSILPAAAASTRGVLAGSALKAPLGMITFHGPTDTNLDIDLRVRKGTFLAQWPSGEFSSNRVRWWGTPPVDLVAKIEDESELPFVDAAHWIHKARAGQASYVRRGTRAERFLAYDAELTLEAPLRLQGGPDKYTIVNLTAAPLYDVLLVRNTPQGRRLAWLDELPNSGVKPVAVTAGESPAAAEGVEVTLSEPVPVDSPQAAEQTKGALSQRLSKAGLTETEVAVFVENHASLLFDGEAVVAACRLPQETFEPNLTLSIFPVPAKILRVPLVLVRNLDPQLDGEVERLVAQLGDSKYANREAAQKRLIELGPLAFGPLQKATLNTDVEIAIRAERILLSQNQNPTGQAPQTKNKPPMPVIQRP